MTTVLASLLARATPPPWRIDRPPDGQTYGSVVADCAGAFVWANGNRNDFGDEDVARLIGTDDAALIVHLRNRAEDYEAAFAALDALAHAVTALENRSIASAGEFHVWAEERLVTEARDEAQRVLRRIRTEVAP